MLVFLMGLAAGIMITLAFLELMAEALEISGLLLAASGFVIGSLLMFSLDFLLPHKYFSVDEKGKIDGKFLKTGILITIGISLHNFPEGIAVASGYAYLPKLGLVIAIAMALHTHTRRHSHFIIHTCKWRFQISLFQASPRLRTSRTTRRIVRRYSSKTYPNSHPSA